MKYRKFKNDVVSEVGLGTWQLGYAEWGKDADEEEAYNILETFVENGGTFIDTADIYGAGVSETFIGEFLKNRSEDLLVATKLGRREDQDNGWPQNFTYDFMKKHVEDSLEHLGISQLFLEQLHCIPKEELIKGNVFEHFRKLQQEKLIRYWGASVETTEEALICLEQDGLASLQIIFNIFRQHVADELFARAREKDVALIIRVPLASGMLSGKFNKNTAFAKSDHRNFNANGESFNAGETFSGIEFNHGLELTDKVQKILPEGNMAQWAVRWILDHPEVTTVIPGASRTAQVISNTGASELPHLHGEVHKKLRDLYDREIKSSIRGHY